MAKARSWWHVRRIKHRDAVALSLVSAAFLLAGELAAQTIRALYEEFLAPVADRPHLFLFNLILTILGFTTYFGGLFVLLGGMQFSRGRIGGGRFLVGLGTGMSIIGLVSRLARATLVLGSPMAELAPLTTTLTGVGILLGIGSHTLMGQYALMMKKRARRAWRRWRRSRKAPRRPPSRRGTRA